MTALDYIIRNAAIVAAVLPADRHDDVLSVSYYNEVRCHLHNAPLPGATFEAHTPNVHWGAELGGVTFRGCFPLAEAAAMGCPAELLAVQS